MTPPHDLKPTRDELWEALNRPIQSLDFSFTPLNLEVDWDRINLDAKPKPKEFCHTYARARVRVMGFEP